MQIRSFGFAEAAGVAAIAMRGRTHRKESGRLAA